MRKIRQNLFLYCLIVSMALAGSTIYFGSLPAKKSSSRRFGVTYMTMNNPFYPVLNNELVKYIEGNGDLLILRDPLLDEEKQIEQIEEFIEMGVEGIFINPVNSNTISPVLSKAKAKNIPVIIIDCPVDDQEGVTTQIYSDNYQAGVLCAQDLMRRYEKGTIGLLEHSNVRSGAERIAGFVDTIAQDPRFSIAGRRECYGQTEKAMPAALDLLEENPKIDVLMCLNDPSAIGAMAAVEYLQRSDIHIYDVDGMPEFKSLLACANSAEATALQSPYTMAQKAVESMYAALNGQEVEKEIVIDVSLLNRENAADNDLRSWQ